MKSTHVMIGLASLVGALVLAAPASALTAYSPTGHLNVRSGPGFQYQVVGQMQAKVPAEITGCIADYSWCSVATGGVTGWASAPYLVTDAGGKPTNLQVSGAQLGIPVVVEPVVPAPEVLTYVTQQAVEPVLVNGEVMVGAVLPTAVPVYQVPASPYVYAYVNGQRVLVEPTARRIVYVVR